MMYGGVYYPGGFLWSRLLISIFVFAFIIWLIAMLFRGGRGGGGGRRLRVHVLRVVEGIARPSSNRHGRNSPLPSITAVSDPIDNTPMELLADA